MYKLPAGIDVEFLAMNTHMYMYHCTPPPPPPAHLFVLLNDFIVTCLSSVLLRSVLCCVIFDIILFTFTHSHNIDKSLMCEISEQWLIWNIISNVEYFLQSHILHNYAS